MLKNIGTATSIEDEKIYEIHENHTARYMEGKDIFYEYFSDWWYNKNELWGVEDIVIKQKDVINNFHDYVIKKYNIKEMLNA